MIGVVEVYKGDEKIIEEPNMTMDHLGNQIAFWMSLPRGFSGIETASALYDSSNYTVRAASLAKDADGYNRHAHADPVSSLIAADGIFRVYSYEGDSSTSYRTEKAASFYAADYQGGPSSIQTRFAVLPEDSKPTMTRLESKSTKVLGVPNSLDLGHNLNLTISGNAYKPAGCYAPAGNSTFYVWSSIPNVNAAAGITNLTNTTGFNSTQGVTAKAIDSRGFIRVTQTTLGEGKTNESNQNYFNGLLISYTGAQGLYNNFEVAHVLGITKPDFLCLNFFGGVYTIGLWGFDVQKMISKGMYPPYSQYGLDEIDYKLFARKTFNRDLTYYEGTSQNFSEIQTLKINWKLKFA